MNYPLFSAISNFITNCDDIKFSGENNLQEMLYFSLKSELGKEEVIREPKISKIYDDIKKNIKNFVVDGKDSKIDFVINNTYPFEVKYFDSEYEYIGLQRTDNLDLFFTMPGEHPKESQFFTDFIKILRILTKSTKTTHGYLTHFLSFNQNDNYFQKVIGHGEVGNNRNIIIMAEPKEFINKPIWGSCFYKIVKKEENSVTIKLIDFLPLEEVDKLFSKKEFNGINFDYFLKMIDLRTSRFSSIDILKNLSKNYPKLFPSKYQFKVSFCNLPGNDHLSGYFCEIEKESEF